MDPDRALRDQLIRLLRSGEAHVTLQSALGGVTPAQAGSKPAGFVHSAWEQLEHMRIAQRDILDFSRSADYQALNWPEDYWPPSAAPADEQAWNDALQAFERDLDEFTGLVRDSKRNLFEPFPWGEGQTLLREALLVADHNAYHLGQIVSVLRAAAAWPGEPVR
jgi:uncharacterized damage-inducible protein DinB